MIEVLPHIINAMEKNDVYDVLAECGFEEYSAEDEETEEDEEEVEE